MALFKYAFISPGPLAPLVAPPYEIEDRESNGGAEGLQLREGEGVVSHCT